MDKKKILKTLIEQHVFAPSNKSFATYIGHNAPTVMRMLYEYVETSFTTIETIWDKLKECTLLTDEELSNVALVFDCVGEILLWVKDEGLTSKDFERIIVALCTGQYQAISEDFNSKHGLALGKIMDNNTLIYHAIIVILFIKSSGVDVYGRGKFCERTCMLMNSFDELLQKHFYRNTDAENVLKNICNEQMIELCVLHNVHGTMMAMLPLLQAYIAPEAWKVSTATCGNTFSWGEFSWWKEAGVMLTEEATCWCLQQNEVSRGVGTHNLFRCRIKDGRVVIEDVFRVIFQRMAMLYQCLGATFPTTYIEDKQTICKYKADVSEDIITLIPMGMNTLELPTELHKIWDKGVVEVSGKQWNTLISDYMNKSVVIDTWKFMARKTGIEILDEYEIQDVAVSRKRLTIDIHDVKDNTYQRLFISVDANPMLKQVKVEDVVFVCRHVNDATVYVQWFFPEFGIPMDEFKECK